MIRPEELEKWYQTGFEQRLLGRWVRHSDICPLLNEMAGKKLFKVVSIGDSVDKRPIYSVAIGNGPEKILIWSQMHGNESTGTKALFDMFRFFASPQAMKPLRELLLKRCTLLCIPMLNPDGAELFTRVNKFQIDLNRDAVALQSPESKYLRAQLEHFRPRFCFNLHDQRSIFGAGDTGNPAIISFLAPSEDKNRTVTKGRKQTMAVIARINAFLANCIKGCIGRYDDKFYPTATGDVFQKEGFNTILIEAGYHKGDDDRELARKYNFYALIYGFYSITMDGNNLHIYKSYFSIPNNERNFYDIIYRNVKMTLNKTTVVVDIGIIFKETIENEKYSKIAIVENIGDLSYFCGHEELDIRGERFLSEVQGLPSLQEKADFLLRKAGF